MKLGRRRKSHKGWLVSIVSYSCRSLRISLVGAFSVIVKTGCGTDGALHSTRQNTLYKLYIDEVGIKFMWRNDPKKHQFMKKSHQSIHCRPCHCICFVHDKEMEKLTVRYLRNAVAQQSPSVTLTGTSPGCDKYVWC